MNKLAEQLADKIERTPLQDEPCCHVQFDDFFPDDVFEEMITRIPEARFFVDLKHGDAMRADGTSTRTRIIMSHAIMAGFPQETRLFWREIIDALRSKEVETAYQRLFADPLTARFGGEPTDVQMFPHIMLMRDMAGYKIAVHNDSPSKAITTQYYLPDDDDRAYLGTQFFRRENGKDTMARQIPFVRNGGYAFPIADNSWHGVEQMDEHERPRHSLMLIFYVTPAFPKRLLLRVKDAGQAVRARTLAAIRQYA